MYKERCYIYNVRMAIYRRYIYNVIIFVWNKNHRRCKYWTYMNECDKNTKKEKEVIRADNGEKYIVRTSRNPSVRNGYRSVPDYAVLLLVVFKLT